MLSLSLACPSGAPARAVGAAPGARDEPWQRPGVRLAASGRWLIVRASGFDERRHHARALDARVVEVVRHVATGGGRVTRGDRLGDLLVDRDDAIERGGRAAEETGADGER